MRHEYLIFHVAFEGYFCFYLVSSFAPTDFQEQKDFNTWKADKRLTVCHFRESSKGSCNISSIRECAKLDRTHDPPSLWAHTQSFFGGVFSINHDSWAAESRGDSHSYSWLRQGTISQKEHESACGLVPVHSRSLKVSSSSHLIFSLTNNQEGKCSEDTEVP